MYEYIKDPLAIEKRSFEIIEREMKNPFLERVRAHIVKRVIHTTTDFDYEEILAFKEGVEDIFMRALQEGCTIVADTKMIEAGLNKALLSKFSLKVVCYVADPSVKEKATEQGMTRSMAAIDYALDQKGKKLFVIGNAPTALYRILEKRKMHKEEIVGVIGVPVGFVGAAESKEALWQDELPSIVTKGRKGGSTVAVAILHALLREMRE